ncbi:hypothetical protein [Peribacillus asahii]|uniref:hypothetical protein n=1 Tax=Peribacillus asahii TaxID=228899 RepID=UPI002079AB87|nr:hypothetical protein [Peribacillus asahii]USK62295.1 hypothetical protein LIT37_24285 [Peribacillus asahii]
MDELEFYESNIQNISRSEIMNEEKIAQILNGKLSNDTVTMHKLIKTRKSLLTEKDFGINYDIFKGLFTLDDKDDVAALVAMLLEIQKENHIHFKILSFEEYDSSQPIFQRHPELLEKLRVKPSGGVDKELIQLNAVQYEPFPDFPKYRTCSYKNSFFLVNGYLNGAISRYLIDKYGKKNLYIRIDPYTVLDQAPPLLLEEEFLRPPNPHWIERLKIHSNQSEGSELFLPRLTGEQVKGDPWKTQQFWEYNEKKIRKLQTIATMKNENHNKNKHFSMSLEELSEESIEDGMLIGRMIHLDSIDSYDTPFDKVKLNHLDLAINVYMGESIEKRLSESLASGSTVTNATFRTHLIRADNIMFADILEIAPRFFKSQTMFEEWVKEQFQFKVNTTGAFLSKEHKTSGFFKK